MSTLILIAIPFFLFLIVFELVVDRRRKTGFYRFNDAISSLQLGVLSRVTRILYSLIPFSFYVYFYHNWRWFDWPETSFWLWLFAFIGYDLVYYWIHRLSHRINIMWASHVVHHSSEEYNLTTALRQTSTPAVFAWIVVAPLAILGVPPSVVAVCAALNLLYQFWVHTRHIDKMPSWFEAIFVTPSHHRVHHALNRDYIDKNFAGVFILWDVLFASFQAEKSDTPVVFGISSQLANCNPIAANVQVYLSLYQDSVVTRGWRNKIKVWLSPPSWRSEQAKQQVPRSYVTTKTMKKYDPVLTNGQKSYLLVQHIMTLILTFSWLLSLANFSTAFLLLGCAFAIYNLYVIGELQQTRPLAISLETLRLLLLALVLWSLMPATIWSLTFALIYPLCSYLCLLKAFKANKPVEHFSTE